MCDAFDVGKCPCSIITTSNAFCFTLLLDHLRHNFILYDIVSFSETDKGILLFSVKDRDECTALLQTLFSQAAESGNCFHKYVLSDSFSSNQSKPVVRECDSTS